MRTGLVLMVALVQAVACSGGDGEGGGASETAMEEASAVLVLASVEARGPQSQPGTPVELFNPMDVLVTGNRVVVTDNGNDRLVLMDAQLNVHAVVGREGGGPGEFEGPYGLRPFGDGFAVFDFGNMRFTILGPEGTYRSVVKSPLAASSYAITSGGAIYTPHRNRHWYLLRVEGDAVTEFAARPDTGTATDSLDHLKGGHEPHVAVTAGDTVHVLDRNTAILHKYGPDGRLLLSRSLPVALADTLMSRSKELEEQFGEEGRFVSVPFVKGFNVTGSGALLLFLARSDRTGALVIDPQSYRAQRIVVPDGRPEWRALLTATSAFLAEPLLYLVQGEEVIAFRIAERE